MKISAYLINHNISQILENKQFMKLVYQVLDVTTGPKQTIQKALEPIRYSLILGWREIERERAGREFKLT